MNLRTSLASTTSIVKGPKILLTNQKHNQLLIVCSACMPNLKPLFTTHFFPYFEFIKVMELQSNNKVEESMRAPADHRHSEKRKKRRNICIAVTALTLVVIMVLVILGLTVFKVKRPVTAIDSVAPKDFNISLDVARLRVYLNITLLINLSVTNPNKVGFKYTNSSAQLKYRGVVVGDVPIPAGKIGAGEKKEMNVTLTIFGDRLVYNSNLYADAISGTLPLTTYTRIAGKVRILNLFNIHVVSSTTCDLLLNVRNGGSLENQGCHYKTKF